MNKHRHYAPYRDPQAEEARIVTYCDQCEEAICEGYDYYQVGFVAICDDCMTHSHRVAGEEENVGM